MRKIYILILFFCFVSSYYAQKIVNLQEAKKTVEDYYESGQYEIDLKKIISEAESKINKLSLPLNSAVIFDVDETALSNYEIIKDINFGYEPNLWDKWVKESKAPAILEVKKFYDWLLSKKIKIIFLSGRTIDEEQATIKNLKNAGYSVFDTLITKKPNDQKISTAVFKEREREKLSKKGYHIIACIGDQWSDMKGKYTGIKIKLPNYMYIIN
ncbi:HAD family acid phosphatase [Melioribacteraceae bacterium 4301-Me]|uniref:HAD family acid phosphatase n=1 Tax=Pyranulibacter aquaticus TaxID=3163344 RepID=UPI00359B4964